MSQIYSRLLKKPSPISPIPSTPPIRHTESLPPFPLFRLPQLAYKNVIDLMNFSEQVNISLCSRRTNSIMKYNRHRPITLEIWIFNNDLVKVSTGYYKTLNMIRSYSTVLGAKKMSPDIDVSETVLIGKHRVPAKLISLNGHQYLKTYWEDEDLGLREIGDYVCDLFRVDISCFKIEKDHRRMFDWINNRQPSIGLLRLEEKQAKLSGNDLKYIVSNCNAKQLFCDTIRLENFRIDRFVEKFDMLAFRGCDWITMDNLMTVEANQIVTIESKFTKKEVNRFLRHWINGGSPRMKFFKVDVEDVDLFEFLDGLMDHFVQGAPGQRTFLSVTGFKYDFLDFGIRRNDGTVASMILADGQIFRLGVWPDEMGRTFNSVS